MQEKVAIITGAASGIGYLTAERFALIEYAVSQVGSDRILFGTDTYAAGAQRGRIEYAFIWSEQNRKPGLIAKSAPALLGWLS